MTQAIARLIALLTLALAVTACAPTVTPAAQSIDGFVPGPPRTVSGPEFHRLEVTARTVAASAWPTTHAVSFFVYDAGALPDGSIQRETEGPFRFLMVVGLVGGARHAMVIECDKATFPDPDSCARARDGS